MKFLILTQQSLPFINLKYMSRYANFCILKSAFRFPTVQKYSYKFCHSNKKHFEDKIKKVATHIHQSSSILVMTGAGLSTPSGIPDFRSVF